MFKIEIGDSYNGFEDAFEFDSLEEALDTVKNTVLGGKSPECISIWQEIPFDVDISVTVKAK